MTLYWNTETLSLRMGQGVPTCWAVGVCFLVLPICWGFDHEEMLSRTVEGVRSYPTPS